MSEESELARQLREAKEKSGERRMFQFEQASVIYSEDFSLATNRRMPKLYVQIIDQYGFQREWTLQYRWEPGNSKVTYWESYAYRHPGRREIQKVTANVAERLIARFLELCEKYPSLLFNKTGEHETDKARPRHEGFVRFSEMLLDGLPPSVKTLDRS